MSLGVERLHLPGFEPVARIEPPDPRPTTAPPTTAPPVAATPDPEVAEPAVAPTDEPPFRVEVTRSAKRRRTVGAHLVGDVLRVTIPSWMSRAEEAHWAREMTARFARRQSAERIDLADRAATLARRHGLRRPAEIRWAEDMTTRWASCTPATGTIRVSNRIAKFPDWVVDYVLVHELAHLDVPGHGDDFWAIVHRYPRAERAIGYLIAKSAEE